ncbi:MAG: acyloxyacyl hydrolase, partial [Deltaproteobacteria bacterium]|nr:acyloxyacyl hydrolase [Deltaproteobacteria bacterium]
QKATLNLRYQHTSNAGLYDENPGLNLMMVGLGYRF